MSRGLKLEASLSLKRKYPNIAKQQLLLSTSLQFATVTWVAAKIKSFAKIIRKQSLEI
jgi:hypothetical protein